MISKLFENNVQCKTTTVKMSKKSYMISLNLFCFHHFVVCFVWWRWWWFRWRWWRWRQRQWKMKLACIHRTETVRLTTAGEGDETSSGVLTDSMIFFSTLRSFPVMKTAPMMKANTVTVSGEVVSVWFRFPTDEDKHSDGFQWGCERLVSECCWSTTVQWKPYSMKWAFVLERNENSCETKWAFVWFGGCMTKWIGV